MNARVSTGIGVGVSVATESSRHLKASPIRQAVLALLLEQPSWAYEVCRRLERRFAAAIQVTDPRVYQVIEDLLRAGLVKDIANPEAQLSRRAPRQQYAVTPAGERIHREWLAESLRDDAHRSAMLVDILATSIDNHGDALRLLDLYERAILDSPPRRLATGLQADLIERERRMTREARLRWVEYARQRLRAEQ